MINLLKGAENESKQLLKNNRKLSSALDITQNIQDKYLDILKKLIIVELKTLEVQKNLARKLDY